MFYKVWNVDRGFMAVCCACCEDAANRLADQLERETGDMHVLVLA